MRGDAGEAPVERRPLTTLAALFLSAGAWTAFVLFAWALVPLACDRGSAVLLHAVAAGVLAVGAAGVVLALRLLREESAAGRAAGHLAVAAVSLSALFTAGIALFWVFTASFDACWR